MAEKRFNEGKALDAVLRIIEGRIGETRSDLHSPEEEHHAAPIELTCKLGGALYAFEHTGIEPFRDQLRMTENNRRLFEPVKASVQGALPRTEAFELLVDIDVSVRKRLERGQIGPIQSALASWIVATAPKLPIAKLGRRVVPIRSVEIEGVPFRVSLHRSPPFNPPGGLLDVTFLAPRNLEDQRLSRLGDMCAKKYGKLQKWKDDFGARTILVLEDADISLTNHVVVAEALASVEGKRADIPDEVYLVSTYLPQRWAVVCLRRGSWSEYHATIENWEYETVEPSILTALTAR